MSPQLARAARFVSDHPEQVALGSMRSLARTLGVSPATMTRLARALGYGSFGALRSDSAAALVKEGSYAHRAQRLRDASRPPAKPLAGLNTAQVAAVQSFQARNGEPAIEAFCRALLRARHVGFLGLRASHAVAFHFSYVYGFLFDNGTLLGNPAGALLDDVCRLSARDALVAITVAPYTRATLDCARSAADRGVRILAITDSRSSPLSACAKQALLVDTDSPSFFSTMAGLLACVEALILHLALLQGERAVDRLAAIDERLRRAGAYHDTSWRRNLRVSR
jgi:DNA-binding MurR/RpiR family transcriptional regulator